MRERLDLIWACSQQRRDVIQLFYYATILPACGTGSTGPKGFCALGAPAGGRTRSDRP
jgi:hypothetical protein